MTATTAPTGTYKSAVGEALVEKTAKRSFTDTLKAAPRKARAFIASTAKTLHIDGALSALGDLGVWIKGRLTRPMRLLRGLGVINILGLLITTPLRHKAVMVLGKVYKAVTAPIRLIGRALAWGLNKFGWGRKVVEKVTEKVAQAETFVVRKVNEGLAWLDRHDDHGAMSWARWYFQATLARRTVRMAFPKVSGWVVMVVGLAIPVYGDRKSPEEEAAIENAKVVLADKPDAPKPEAPKASKADQGMNHKYTVILTDTALPAEAQTFETVAFDDANGTRVLIKGQWHLSTALPEGMALVGRIAGEGDQVKVPHPDEVEKKVRSAQANPAGRPPRLPRAAQRAAAASRKATSKK